MEESLVKKIKIVGKIAYWLLVAVVVFLAGITLLSTFNTKLTTNLFVVQSGSMQPTISVGSLVLVKKDDNFTNGDIITFLGNKSKAISPQDLTTHRIVEVKKTILGEEYVTKGDANNATDSATIKKSQILGKVILTIPLLGYPISFTKSLPGLIIVIVIPATIIVYQEMINLKNDLKKKLSKKKEEEKDD